MAFEISGDCMKREIFSRDSAGTRTLGRSVLCHWMNAKWWMQSWFSVAVHWFKQCQSTYGHHYYYIYINKSFLKSLTLTRWWCMNLSALSVDTVLGIATRKTNSKVTVLFGFVVGNDGSGFWGPFNCTDSSEDRWQHNRRNWSRQK